MRTYANLLWAIVGLFIVAVIVQAWLVPALSSLMRAFDAMIGQ